jgi:hypothetical protein
MTCLPCRQELLLDAADAEDLARQRDLARHRHVGYDWLVQRK